MCVCENIYALYIYIHNPRFRPSICLINAYFSHSILLTDILHHTLFFFSQFVFGLDTTQHINPSKHVARRAWMSGSKWAYFSFSLVWSATCADNKWLRVLQNIWTLEQMMLWKSQASDLIRHLRLWLPKAVI